MVVVGVAVVVVVVAGSVQLSAASDHVRVDSLQVHLQLPPHGAGVVVVVVVVVDSTDSSMAIHPP